MAEGRGSIAEGLVGDENEDGPEGFTVFAGRRPLVNIRARQGGGGRDGCAMFKLTELKTLRVENGTPTSKRCALERRLAGAGGCYWLGTKGGRRDITGNKERGWDYVFCQTEKEK